MNLENKLCAHPNYKLDIDLGKINGTVWRWIYCKDCEDYSMIPQELIEDPNVRYQKQ